MQQQIMELKRVYDLTHFFISLANTERLHEP